MEITVNCKTGHQSHNCSFENTKEEGSSEERNKSNNNNWSPNAANFSMSNMFHYKQEGEAVSNSNSNLSEKNEYLSNQVSKGELKAVLDVKKESVPCSHAEVITSNSNIGKSGLVDIVNNLFNALKNAFSNADNKLDNLIVTSGLFSFLGKVHKYKFDELNNSNNE
jgi:hypothetical protein